METADPVSSRQQRLTLAAATLGRSLVFLEVTIVSVALPSIQRDLGVSTSFLVWIVNGYLLAMCVLLVAAGRLGDLLGHRRIFELGLAVFALATAACALAPSPSLLLAARVAQGVGAALLFPPAQSLVTYAYPPEERGRALSILIAGSAVAFAVGPFAGGVLADYVGWRSIFWISVPPALAALAMTRAYVREAREPGASRSISPLSVALFAVGLAAVVIGLMQVGPWGLGSPGVLALLVVGAAVLILFAVREPGRSAPLIDFGLFRNRVFSGATAAMFTYQWVFLVFTVFTLVYLQLGLRYSPSGAGVVFLPVGLALVPSLLLAGRIVDRFGFRLPLLGGLTLLGAALLWVALIAVDASATELAAPFVLFGVAVGFTIVPIQTSGMNAVAASARGLAAGILGAVRQVGGVFGIAAVGLLLTTMERNRVDAVVEGLPPAKRVAERQDLDGLLAGHSQAQETLGRFDVETGARLRTDVADAVDDAFASGLRLTAVLVVASIAVVAFLLRPRRLLAPSAAPSE